MREQVRKYLTSSSPNVRVSGLIPESGKFLLVESGIQGFGIQNRAQVLGNPTKEWNLESTFQ